VRSKAQGSGAIRCDIVGFESPASRWLATGCAWQEGGSDADVDAGGGLLGGELRREEVRARTSAAVGGDARGEPVSLKLGPGGAVHGVRSLRVLVIEALLEAAPDGGEDGFGRSGFRCLSTRDRVVRCVSGRAGSVDLQEHNGVKKSPGRL